MLDPFFDPPPPPPRQRFGLRRFVAALILLSVVAGGAALAVQVTSNDSDDSSSGETGPTTSTTLYEGPSGIAVEFVRRAIDGDDLDALVLPVHVDAEGQATPDDHAELRAAADEMAALAVPGGAVEPGNGDGVYEEAEMGLVGPGCVSEDDVHIDCHVVYRSPQGVVLHAFHLTLAEADGVLGVDSIEPWANVADSQR